MRIFLYKHHQKTLPEVFSHFFEMNNTVHDHYTRQEKPFHVPLYKSLQKSKCLRCSGVKISNCMVKHMNYNCSYVSFEYVPNKHLLRNDMTQLLAVLWFYFPLWLCPIYSSTSYAIVRCLFCRCGNIRSDSKHPFYFAFHASVYILPDEIFFYRYRHLNRLTSSQDTKSL